MVVISVFCILLILNVFIFVLPNSDVINELMEAVHNADYKHVKFLLSLDPEVLSSRPPVLVDRADDINNRTSLLVCGLDMKNRNRTDVDSECKRIAKALYQGGAAMKHVDKFGWDALSMGAVRGFTKFCRYLITEHHLDPNRQDVEGRTALMKAAGHGYFDTFAMLLNNGANLSIVHGENNLSAVHYGTIYAMQNPGQIEFLQNLTSFVTGRTELRFKHSPQSIDSFVDKDKRTALMYAAISNNIEVCAILLAAGADPRRVDGFGVPCHSMPSSETLRGRLVEAGITLTEQEHMEWLQKSSKKKKTKCNNMKVEL